MRGADATQLSIDIEVKNRLDRYKAVNKERIIAAYKPRRRWATNSLAIRYMLDSLELWPSKKKK